MDVFIEGDTSIAVVIASAMHQEGHDVVFIGKDLSFNQRDTLDRHQIRTVIGTLTDSEIFEAVQPDTDSMFIAATGSDEKNLVLCRMVGLARNWKWVVCRIRNPELQELLTKRKTDFNIDELLIPERWINRYLSNLINHAGSLQVLEFHAGEVIMIGVKVLDGSEFVNKDIATINQIVPDIPMKIVSIYRHRNASAVFPRGDTEVYAGDDVFFVLPGRAEERNHYIDRIISKSRGTVTRNRHVIIAGGGQVGEGLARILEEGSYQVKIIEENEARCDYLSRTLKKTIVLRGVANDKELLESEFAGKADVFVAVTNDDECNFLSCLLSKKLGAQHCISLINNEAYLELVEGKGIDVVVVPGQITTGSVIALGNDLVSQVSTLRRGAAEAIEILVKPESLAANKRIKDLKLSKLGANIGAIVRDEKYMVADAEALVLPNDALTLFLTRKDTMRDVESLFVHH